MKTEYFLAFIQQYMYNICMQVYIFTSVQYLQYMHMKYVWTQKIFKVQKNFFLSKLFLAKFQAISKHFRKKKFFFWTLMVFQIVSILFVTDSARVTSYLRVVYEE